MRRPRTAASTVLVMSAFSALLIGWLIAACGSGGEARQLCESAACDSGAVEGGAIDSADDPQSSDARPDVARDSGLPDHDASGSCIGEAGALDNSFGEAGLVSIKLPGVQGTAIVVQPDGRVVVGGSLGSTKAIVLRTLANGTLDPSFGAAGVAELAPGEFSNIVSALAVQPDGKIVAAGAAGFSNRDPDFAVMRLLPDGSLDESFGTGGVVLTDFDGRGDYAHSIAIQPDGRILVAGLSELNAVGSTSDYVVARYSSNGALDATFGADGRVAVDVRGTIDSPGVMALLPGGKIVVAGGSGESTNLVTRSDVSAVRLSSDGSLDATFGNGGKVLTSFGLPGSHQANAIAVDPAGRTLLAGATGADFLLTRLATDGAVDAAFGTSGSLLTDFNGRGDDAAGVVVQADGRIVLAGQSGAGDGTLALAIARYNPSGLLDSAFGQSGRTLILPPPTESYGVSGTTSTACELLTVGTWLSGIGTVPRNAIGIARFRR